MIEEDYEAWEAYPQYRWVFNKLELSMRLGYDCGPACVPIKNAGNYIIRPTYNLYGMGIGAHKKFLNPSIHGEEMIHHKHIPPGYFWCEWFDGNHQSVDFIKDNNHWVPFHAMTGKHEDKHSLTKFIEWEVTEPEITLPDWLHDITTEKYLNVETRGGKIIEVHLRSGNDVLWDYYVGTKVIPVWKGVDYKEYEHLPFIGNLHSEEYKYEADGNLSDIRLGYYVNKKK